jgi:hypothetical protein
LSDCSGRQSSGAFPNASIINEDQTPSKSVGGGFRTIGPMKSPGPEECAKSSAAMMIAFS